MNEREQLMKIREILDMLPHPKRQDFDNDDAFAVANDWYNKHVVPLWRWYEDYR